MSATNHTTNYNLSQFVGTDKPAWLQDYNGDMGKIDTAIKNASDAATTAGGTATALSTAVGDNSNLTTTEKTTIVGAVNEVNVNATTALNTANSALASASQALTDLQKLNLTVTGTLTASYTINNGAPVVISDATMRYAKDSSDSVFKVYGYIVPKNLGGVTGNLKITITGLDFDNDADYIINSAVIRLPKYVDENAYTWITNSDITIKQNGNIEITFDNLGGDIKEIRYLFLPILFFNKNFGNTPTPE